VRTNLGRADLLRGEILAAHAKGVALQGLVADIGMHHSGTVGAWSFPDEPGYFRAKAYLLDERAGNTGQPGRISHLRSPGQLPDGQCLILRISRFFGFTKTATKSQSPAEAIRKLDEAGFQCSAVGQTARPEAGVTAHLWYPRVPDPAPATVNPTPTTYARSAAMAALTRPSTCVQSISPWLSSTSERPA